MHTIIFKNFKSKKIKIYILTLSILICVVNIISLTINYINLKIENRIFNKLENRIIYINDTENDRLSTIESIIHVDSVYYNISPFLVDNNGKNIYLKYINPLTNLKILSGKSSKINNNEVIVPDTFFDSQTTRYDGFLNKKISLSLNDKVIKFNIVGIYSSDNESGEYIYIANNNIISNFIKEKNEYIALIDDKDNYNKVMKELKKLNFSIIFSRNPYDVETLTYQDIIDFLNVFSIFCYICLILLYIFLSFSNILEKKYNIALLKVFGYSNIFIQNILSLNFIYILLISFSISIILIKGTDLFLLYIFGIKSFWSFNIIFNNFITMLFLLIIILFFSLLKIKRISIIKLLKNK